MFGMALMPQGEARAAAARIQVSVPENRVHYVQAGRDEDLCPGAEEQRTGGAEERKGSARGWRARKDSGPLRQNTRAMRREKESMAPGGDVAGLLRVYGQTGRRPGAVQGGLRRVRRGSPVREDIGGSSSFYVNVAAQREREGRRTAPSLREAPGETWQGAGGAQDGPCGLDAGGQQRRRQRAAPCRPWQGGFENGPVTGGGQAASGTVPRVIVTGFDTDPGEVKAGNGLSS